MSPALRWSAIGAGDVHAWAALLTNLDRVDATHEVYAPADLLEELTETGVDPTRDTFAVWDADTMVAYAQLRMSEQADAHARVRCWHAGGVHGDYRGRGIGTELLARLHARGAQKVHDRFGNVPYFFRTPAGRPTSPACEFLTTHGYAIVRYWHTLRRELDTAPPVAAVPGFTLRSPTEHDESAIHAAHLLAFADHWGNIPISAARWHEAFTSRSVRHQLATLASDTHGQVAAYVLASQWVERELHITLVGTVPSARGQGLAAACLARTIAQATASGAYDRVELEVDTESPTGASRVYERAGFVTTETTTSLEKHLPGA